MTELVTTKEQYAKLADEWQACEYVVSQAASDDPERRRAMERQVEIEKLQDASRFEFDENDNVIEIR